MTFHPRVVHVINGEYFGGSARVLINYLGSPSRHADVAVVVHFRGEVEKHLRDLNVPIVFMPMRNRFDLSVSRDLLAFSRDWQADLIHTHQVRNTLVARIASLLGGPQVITHVHSPAFRESTRQFWNVTTGGIDRALAGRTRRFIAVSRSLQHELTRLGIHASKVTVVPNGIPLPPSATVQARVWLRNEFQIPPGDLVVGMVANLRPRKGADVLIDACGRLVRAGRNVHLLLIGEVFAESHQDYSSELVTLGRRAGLDRRLVMTGFRRDTREILAGLDVFALPSLFGEGMPMALLEAMGAGIPAVSTPTEGIREVITSGENGLLVPPQDAAALADALRLIDGDHRFGNRIAIAGRLTVEQRFSAAAMTKGIESVYQDVLGR